MTVIQLPGQGSSEPEECLSGVFLRTACGRHEAGAWGWGLDLGRVCAPVSRAFSSGVLQGSRMRSGRTGASLTNTKEL